MKPCGVLLLDKPEGLSSNHALQRTRRLLGSPKAGHVGSLDPLATGMLPICVGEATKIAGEILGGRKCYEFTLQLGARTDTGDREGTVIERAASPQVSAPELDAVLAGFLGPQTQVPPMYSALKRDGQPLYRLARAGIEVERAPRQIEIYALALLQLTPEALRLEVLCSKGTYVRTLGEDIARALGSCGHLGQLRRRYVEPFAAYPMLTLEALEALVRGGATPSLLAPDEALAGIPAIALPATAAQRLRQGQALALGAATTLGAAAAEPGRVRLYEQGGCFLGLGELDPAGLVRPKRLFAAPDA
ncbi:MAG TPA: tRNA pseudouridine(55) synthase TruB [Steroidobacteraceae bacterium]|nr:tRNA pseudouridine(55) synthase TruB [Steroidobacteraceae bacterium]